MRRAVLFACLLFLVMLLLPVISSAVYDPPHNEASSVTCAGCHGKALLLLDSQNNPIGSPFWTNSTSEEAYNAVCRRCHVLESNVGDIDGYTGNRGPLVQSHAPGSTMIKCTECHNNHEQDQIYPGKYSQATFFIAKGSRDTGRAFQYEYADPPDNTVVSKTVIPYSSFSATNDPGNWTDLVNLGAKTGARRGAMLIPDISATSRRWPVYMIDSVDTGAGTITVKGEITSASNLGIFYGQLIRSMMIVDSEIKYVEFYDRTGTKSFAHNDTPGGDDSTPNSICQVCHTQTNHWRNDGTVSMDGTHRTYSGTNCMICHDHATDEFNAECDTCHGYPPAVLSGLLQSPDDTGSLTVGAHTAHVNTKGYSCDYCHLESYGKAASHNNGNKGGGDKNITMGFSLFGGEYQGGDYDGQDTAQYNATATSPVTTVNNTGVKTCSDLYCHGTLPGGSNWGGGTDTTPVWDGTVACGDCHRATAATPPTSGQHQKHARVFSSGYNYDCGFCHKDPGVDGTLHGNNRSEVVFSNDPKVSGGTYNGNNDMLGSYGSCDNLYCHSTVQSSPPGSDPTFRTTPAWNGSMGGCDKCHYTWGSNPGLETGSHDPHFFNDEGQQCYGCHNWQGDDNECFACHLDGDFHNYRLYHANHQVNVMFSPKYGGSYSGSLAPGDAYGSCSDVYCHGNYDGSGLNATPTWNDPPSAACGTCHGAANNAVLTSGTHSKHAGDGIIDVIGGAFTNQKNIACTVCHEDIIDGSGPDSYTIQSKAKHVNQKVDWKFDTADSRITGSESYSVASGTQLPTDGDTGAGNRDYGTCSNVYCHSNAQPDGGVGPPDVYTTPANLKWGSQAGCFGCHAGEIGPADNSTYAIIRHTQSMTDPATATGSHYEHLGSSTQEGRCELCHNWFYPSNTNMSQCGMCHHSDEGIRALHVDGKVDVLFNQYAVFPYGWKSAPYDTIANTSATYNGTPAPGDGYGSCSNVYCHSDATIIRTGDGSYTNTTPQWGTSVAGCNLCHGNSTYADWRQGMPEYANGSPKENSHVEHINQAEIDNCSFCHSDTTLDGLSINKEFMHADSYYNAQYERDTDGTGLNTFAGREVKLRYQRTTTTITQQSSSSSGNCSAITCHGYPDYLVFTQQQDYVPVKANVFWGEYVTCGDCHLREAANGTVGQADVDSYEYGDGLHGSIDNDQWLYSGHGRPAADGSYDVSNNPAANFGGAADCTDWSTNFFDDVKFPFEEERCDPCFYCHDDSVIHDDGNNPFRLSNNNALGNGWNDVCLVCHGTGSAGYDPDGVGTMGSVNRTTSNAVDKYHSGHLHGAGNDGGSLCWDCHDPHGDRIAGDGNIFMIHERVTVEKLDEFGTPDLTVFQPGLPIFTDNQTGSDYASVNPAPYDGICNVCHAIPASGGPDHYSWQHGDGHNIDQKCTDCHLHSADTIVDGNAFKPSCDTCHGFPPIAGSLGGPDGLADNEGGTGSVTSGAHVIHATQAEYNYACTTCHTGGMPVSAIYDKDIQIGFSAGGRDGSGTAYGGQSLSNGYAYVGTNNTTVTNSGTLVCSNTYCHSTGRKLAEDTDPPNANLSLKWDGSSPDPQGDGDTCNNCHLGTATGPGFSPHSVHVQIHNYTCDYCHYPTTADGTSISDKSKHVNGAYDIGVGPGLQYKYLGIWYNVGNYNYTYMTNGGQCSNVACHDARPSVPAITTWWDTLP